RMRVISFHPVHHAKVIDGPFGQRRAEGECRLDRHQAIIGASELRECGEGARQGPAYGPASRVTANRETGNRRRNRDSAIELPSGPPGYVEATLRIDAQRGQEAVNAADSELGEVSQGRAQVRRADRRQAQDPSLPDGVSEKPARIETAHA